MEIGTFIVHIREYFYVLCSFILSKSIQICVSILPDLFPFENNGVGRIGVNMSLVVQVQANHIQNFTVPADQNGFSCVVH